MRAKASYGFAEPPVLYVPQNVWQELQTYVQLCPLEINGFGTIQMLGDTRFRLDRVFILEQTVGPGHVNITDEVMHKNLYEMARAGIDTGTVRFQWHSHVNMEAYMSGVDLANIERYNRGWMISMVTNKRGDRETRLDIFDPFRITCGVNVVIEMERNPEIEKHCKKQMIEKVKRESFVGLGGGRVRPVKPKGNTIPTADTSQFANQ